MRQMEDPQYKKVFRALPGKILVLLPISFEIIVVTDEYLMATNTCEHDLVGKSLFEVFPDNPEDQQADGVENLSASLKRVLSLKTTDIMSLQRYPIRSPEVCYVEHFWSVANSPIFNDAGEVEFLMHRVEDVTGIVRESADPRAAGGNSTNDSRNVNARNDILIAQELKLALTKLQEYETRIHAAERTLNLGTWELNPKTGSLNWSPQVFDIYGIPEHQTELSLEEYFELVHPEDQELV